MLDSKILIIDDEVELLELVAEMLIPNFPEVKTVSDSDQALALLQSETFSLIITDVNMPKIPGQDLVRILRSQGKLTPIIFITGNANKDMILTALRLGAADILEKPFDDKVLNDSVNRVIEIDRRKQQLILDNANPSVSTESINKQKKMLGLLHVLTDKKKT